MENTWGAYTITCQSRLFLNRYSEGQSCVVWLPLALLMFALVRVGGIILTIPPVFLCEKNGGAQRHRFGCIFLCIPFAALPQNFYSRSSQIRSPGQLKRPYHKNIHDSIVTTFFTGLVRIFQELIKASIATKRKTYISDFLFWWAEDRSSLRPDHYKTMGKCPNALLQKYEWKRSVYLKTFSLEDPCVVLTQWPVLRAFEVIQSQCLSLMFDRIEIERWWWPQCVSLA